MYVNDNTLFKFKINGANGSFTLTNATATLYIKRPDSSIIIKDCQIDSDYAYVRLYEGDISEPGNYMGQLKIVDAEGNTFHTYPFSFEVKKRIYD